MKNLLIKMGLIGAFLAIGFSGCGSGSSSGGDYYNILDNDSSVVDSLTIKQSGNNFSIVWDKKYGGYSEVVYMSEVTEDKRGSNIMNDNFGGKHTLNCTLNNSSGDSVSYSCVGSSPSIAGIERNIEKNLYFSKGKEYRILINYNAFELRHGEINYILEFNSDTLTIH